MGDEDDEGREQDQLEDQATERRQCVDEDEDGDPGRDAVACPSRPYMSSGPMTWADHRTA